MTLIEVAEGGIEKLEQQVFWLRIAIGVCGVIIVAFVFFVKPRK